MIIIQFLFSFAMVFAEIPNLAPVTAGIYRGGRPEDFDDLRRLAIKTDINLQGGDLETPYFARLIAWWEPGETEANIAFERSAAIAAGIEFYNLRLNSLAPVDAQEDERVDLILKLLADPSKRPLFIHCEHGKDRTGLIIALYRVKHQHWSAKAAHAEWIRLGHGEVARVLTRHLDDYFFKKVKEFVK